jgi:DNA polymerase-1
MPDDMPGQIDRIEQILRAMNIPIMRVPGFEADDLIGTLAKKAGTSTNTAVMLEQMGITPAQFIEVLALQGDTADNVPGIPDVGPKTACFCIGGVSLTSNLRIKPSA